MPLFALNAYVLRAPEHHHKMRAAAAAQFDLGRLKEFWEEIEEESAEEASEPNSGVIYFQDAKPTTLAEFMPDHFVYAVAKDDDGNTVVCLTHKRDLNDSDPHQSDMDVPDYFMECSGFDNVQECTYELAEGVSQDKAAMILDILGVERSEKFEEMFAARQASPCDLCKGTERIEYKEGDKIFPNQPCPRCAKENPDA